MMMLSKKSSTTSLLICLTFFTTQTTHAFLQDLMQRFQPKPELDTFSARFPGTVLDIRLDVDDGKNNGSSANQQQSMCIQNLVLSLNDNESKSDDIKNLPMPGFNGPHPTTSGGVRNANVLQTGHFIALSVGMVKAKFAAKANWELIWRDGSPAGALICALELEEDAVRNQAKLPRGRIYMSFPVWTADKLAEFQGYKEDCIAASAVHLQERDDQIAKMKETNNLLAKALHYRNAFAAVEKNSLQPRKMLTVPSNNEVVPISDELFLTRTGTVWTKSNSGSFAQSKQLLLGTASISIPPPAVVSDAESSTKQATTSIVSSNEVAP